MTIVNESIAEAPLINASTLRVRRYRERRAMASDLLAIADDLEETPRKQFRYEDRQRLVA